MSSTGSVTTWLGELRAGNRAAKTRLLIGVMEWCLGKKLSHLQTVIDSGTLSSFVEITPRTIPLGLSHPYGGGKSAPGGGECMAFRWPITLEVLEDVRGEVVTASERLFARGVVIGGRWWNPQAKEN